MTAFSNGTEGVAWQANWCDRCLRDAPFRNMGKGSGCPILLNVMCTNEVPAEWIEQDRFSLGDQYHCIEFRGPGDGNPEPRPKPEPPQDGLFERPERGTRMLLPMVDEREWVTA